MKTAEMQVALIDKLGNDLSIVNAARVSFDKISCWENSEYGHPDFEKPNYLSERDKKLIKYLADHNHWSPFAHTSISLRVKAPIFIARQLVKHQVGGAWNEVSRRYVDSEPEFYIPKHEWRLRAENKKQGSEDGYIDPDTSVYVQTDVELMTQMCLDTYNFMIRQNVCPEQARMILPQNTMTEWIWTGSLYFFARVCNLRLDSHAQKEAQDVSKQIHNILKELFPVSTEVLVKENNA